MISLDTETTGVDFHHGARPFFVTTCTHDGDQRWWEWDVDPLTRQPVIPADDLEEIREYLFADGPYGPIGDPGGDDGGLILQNSKFDFRALDSVGFWHGLDMPTVWASVRDTLTAGHLLASNHPHNLTDMALEYLAVDITPFETALEEAVKECRRKVQQAKLRASKGGAVDPLAGWAIAEADRPDMPSAKDKAWKYDTWLPLAMARHHGYPADHPWRTVLRDYANADSAVTVALWQRQRDLIKSRKLWSIFSQVMKDPPVAYTMENHGVTVSGDRLDEKVSEYRADSERLHATCVNLAARYDEPTTGEPYELVLPANGVNASLRRFMLDILRLPPVVNRKAKTSAPTLNKAAMTHYLETLPPSGKAMAFVRSLLSKRACDTAVAYMEGYRRFWLPLPDAQGGTFYVLHPNLNLTGTDTLRCSSSNPNEQNISKREGFNLRYAFGPAPGREWWSIDARGIEDRLPAYESGERDLIAIFEESDAPPYYGSNHLLRFHTVYPDIWEAAVKEVGLDKAGPHCKKKYASTYYQWCKNGGFAVQYGAIDRDGGGGTADQAFHKVGAHKLLKERFSKLEALNQHWIQFANRHGYVETMPDKSVDPERGYPLLCSRTEFGRVLPTVPLNYHIQGTAMWWTRTGMVRVQAQLDEWNRGVAVKSGRSFSQEMVRAHGYFITMQVHDEIVLDFPKRVSPKADPKRSNLGRIRAVVALLHQGGYNIGVPTPVGVEYHPVHWGEGVTVSV